MLQSFKRRYFYLKQQADTTYVMEYHKDDKKLEAKGCIFLDSAVSVVKVSQIQYPYGIKILKKYWSLFCDNIVLSLLKGWHFQCFTTYYY